MYTCTRFFVKNMAQLLIFPLAIFHHPWYNVHSKRITEAFYMLHTFCNAQFFFGYYYFFTQKK